MASVSPVRKRAMQEKVRDRECTRVVGIDQSLKNCALVLFEDEKPIDRAVFHTGDPTTKKHQERLKKGWEVFGEYFEDHNEQVAYIVNKVLHKVLQWAPDKVCLEGLAFDAKGKVERQLAGLYFSLLTSLSRELGYSLKSDLVTITPSQAKKLARDYLPEDQRYLKEYTARGKPKLNPMKKKDMVKALEATEDAWILDGYTRENLVASRKQPTGREDLPDAYFIAKCYIQQSKEK